MKCTKCGLELKYCEECKCYHHVDSFKEEHLEYQAGVKKLQEESDPQMLMSPRVKE